MRKRAYKAVRRTAKGHLISATPYGKLRRYAPNMSTKAVAGDGPLAVFQNVEQADAFCEYLSTICRKLDLPTGILNRDKLGIGLSNKSFEVWIVEYDPSDRHCLSCKKRCPATRQRISNAMPIEEAPQGTVLAETVTLIERVDG